MFSLILKPKVSIKAAGSSYAVLDQVNSSKMSLNNKIFLNKVVHEPILLYGSQVRGSAANSNLQTIQMMQSKALWSVTKSPWYVRNGSQGPES